MRRLRSRRGGVTLTTVLRQLVEWVGAHPHWAGTVVALVAFSESLAFVGLVVPGAVILFAAGALIAGGPLHFWPICLWAIGGAIAGDGLSYWLGRRYRSHIPELRPFRNHPEILGRGKAFFYRHGTKSILLGRFVGPVRPVVPVVAGMLHMRPVRFYVANVLSAFAWAPAYLLPGMAFGASLALAGAVAGRLALLVGLLAAAVWLLTEAVRRLHRFFSPRNRRWALAAGAWARSHRRLAWLLGDLVEPDRPPSRGLTLWVVLLLAGTWLFLSVAHQVIRPDPLAGADRSVQHLLLGLRAPLADRLMVTLAQVGVATVMVPVAAFVALWLAWRRSWHDLAYGSAAAAFGLLAVAALEVARHRAPAAVAPAALADVHFPSAPTMLSVVVYGFVAVLCADELPRRWRVAPYVAAVLLIAGVAVSGLYLGSHRLSDVAAGLSLGAVWAALLAIARQRHPHRHLRLAFGPAVALVLAAAVAWRVGAHLDTDLQRHAVLQPVRTLAAADWATGGWRELPAHRLDLEGEREQPLNLQWAGELPDIRRRLLAHGWRPPVPLDGGNTLRWLSPKAPLAELPVLPQLHDGRHESLLLLHRGPGAGEPLALRLWSSGLRLTPDGTPVWIGTLSRLRLRRLPLLRFPVTGDAFAEAVATARAALPAECRQRTAPARGQDMVVVCRTH